MAFELRKEPHKIAILGTGEGWNLLPVNSDHTIYALNDFLYVERFQIQPDLLFIMDVLDEKPQIVTGIQNLGDVISRINALKIPLVGPYQYEEIPLSMAFPITECVKRFGMAYFNNTIAYMIAYALIKGAKQIDVFGVNQSSGSEYFYEKAGVEYWLGVANGLGVKLTLYGSKSELLTNKPRFGGGLLYGYNMTFPQVLNMETKFGTMIKKLAMPTKQVSRDVRKVI